MKKYLLCIFIALLSDGRLFSIPQDSLHWSIGYGTLYGGGFGLKHHWNISRNNRWQFHFAVSVGLLPKTVDFIQGYTLPAQWYFRIFSLYYLFPFHLVLPKDYIIFRNKLVLPISANVSYRPLTKFTLHFGYGTVAQYVAFEEIKLKDTIIEIFNIYKLAAFSFTTSFQPKRTTYGLSFSYLYVPLKLNKYMFRPTKTLLTFKDFLGLYTITFSIGYSFPDFPPKYLIPKKKNKPI